MAAEAVSVIENKARQTGSTPVAVGNGASTSRVSPTPTGTRVRFVTSSRDLGTLSVPVAGNFQVENLLMALVATEQLESIFGISVPDSVLKTALENFDWPGRFQFLNAEPPVIVDSAHNPAASEALAESITSRYGKRPLSLIFGICGDKDVRGFLRPWQDKVQKLWAVDLPNERSMAKEDAAGIARAMGFEVEALDRGTAGEEAMRFTKECGGALCIAGSLFLAGWALENQNMFQLENNRKKAGKDER
jgi:dihydrofolate synthase/folylpolyglutamate synthase